MAKQSLNFDDALAKLNQFKKEYQRPPSFEEIRKIFRYKSKNAAFWLVDQLISNGLVKKDAQGKLILGATGLKWLGAIQAGIPKSEEAQEIDTLHLDEYLVRNHDKSFLLKVTGDSMIDAGIHEGDLVIVERDRTVSNGDIVVAQVDGEWTLKYYENKGSQIRLVAANKKYAPIRPQHELTLAGVVVSAMRRYKTH